MGVVAKGRTTLLIAHRLQTAAQCDRIIVIDRGVVVEAGSPDDLLAAGGAYARLWETSTATNTAPNTATDTAETPGPIPVP